MTDDITVPYDDIEIHYRKGDAIGNHSKVVDLELDAILIKFLYKMGYKLLDVCADYGNRKRGFLFRRVIKDD